MSLMDKHRILVCVGPGGVGKTTTAAAIALAGARQGKRTLVMTIDPSRRLAQALGMEKLSNIPVSIRLEGEEIPLFAMTPNVKRTFDDLVRAAPMPEKAQNEVLGNRFYRRFTESLAGSLEYAAVEKLYEVDREGEFDLIVLDTPPAQNALDFFDAPGRMASFFGGDALTFLSPNSKSLRALFSVGNTILSKTVGKMAGAETMTELVGLLTAFHGMYAGFRDRAQAVQALLHSGKELGFVLVARPETPSTLLHSIQTGLADQGLAPVAMVLNRVRGSALAEQDPEQLKEALLPLVLANERGALGAALDAECFGAKQTQNALNVLRSAFPDIALVELPELEPYTSPASGVQQLANVLE